MRRYATRYATRYTNRTLSTRLLRTAGHSLRLVLGLILAITRFTLLMRLRLHLLRANLSLARRLYH